MSDTWNPLVTLVPFKVFFLEFYLQAAMSTLINVPNLTTQIIKRIYFYINPKNESNSKDFFIVNTLPLR